MTAAPDIITLGDRISSNTKHYNTSISALFYSAVRRLD